MCTSCIQIYDILTCYLSEHKSWFDQVQRNCPSFAAPVFCCEFNIAATLQQDIITGSLTTVVDENKKNCWSGFDCMLFQLPFTTLYMPHGHLRTCDFTHLYFHLNTGWRTEFTWSWIMFMNKGSEISMKIHLTASEHSCIYWQWHFSGVHGALFLVIYRSACNLLKRPVQLISLDQ